MNALSTYFIDVFKNHYVDFKGRATRTQFWMFQLFLALCWLVLWALAAFVLGDSMGTALLLVAWLAVLLPCLAIAVRRLHDIGRSGWWILLAFIPVVNAIGGIVLFVFYLLPSKE